jgi:hypothetical protein
MKDRGRTTDLRQFLRCCSLLRFCAWSPLPDRPTPATRTLRWGPRGRVNLIVALWGYSYSATALAWGISPARLRDVLERANDAESNPAPWPKAHILRSLCAKSTFKPAPTRGPARRSQPEAPRGAHLEVMMPPLHPGAEAALQLGLIDAISKRKGDPHPWF